MSAFLDRVGTATLKAQLACAFETAFQALWKRSLVSLDAAILGAISTRVLEHGVRAYPVLAALRANAAPNVDFALLRSGVVVVETQQLREVTEFFLSEFLAVIGSVTANVLTEPLHLELRQLEVQQR